MACGGPLSPVMMIAGAGMLPGASSIAGLGSSLGVNSTLTSTLGSFEGLNITSQFSGVVTSATGILDGGVLDSLRTLGADTFPALTNAIPGDFASALSTIAPGGMADGGLSGLVGNFASNVMGGGDLTKFSQIFNSAQGYTGIANQFINSNLNIANLSSTFGPLTGGMDNLMTGSFSQVTQALGPLGGDLANLGNMINMDNLSNLGNPSALVGQLVNVGGLTPGLQSAMRQVGLDSGNVNKLLTGNLVGLPDGANKLLYDAMGKVTGADLQQVKNILGVNLPNVTNMAQLLDPVKILPNSFPALTMPTPDGLRGIYSTVQGAVNTDLTRYLSTPTGFSPIDPSVINSAKLGIDVAGVTSDFTSGISSTVSSITGGLF